MDPGLQQRQDRHAGHGRHGAAEHQGEHRTAGGRGRHPRPHGRRVVLRRRRRARPSAPTALTPHRRGTSSSWMLSEDTQVNVVALNKNVTVRRDLEDNVYAQQDPAAGDAHPAGPAGSDAVSRSTSARPTTTPTAPGCSRSPTPFSAPTTPRPLSTAQRRHHQFVGEPLTLSTKGPGLATLLTARETIEPAPPCPATPPTASRVAWRVTSRPSAHLRRRAVRRAVGARRGRAVRRPARA